MKIILKDTHITAFSSFTMHVFFVLFMFFFSRSRCSENHYYLSFAPLISV